MSAIPPAPIPLAPVPGNSAAARDVAHVLHPYTELAAHRANGPMVISHGKGIRVFDDSGRGYIDAMAGLWCASLGFDNPRLADVAARQMRELPFYHAFASRANEPMIDLAEALLARAPESLRGGKAFFASSGSEANDTAIKLVWYYNNALGRPRKKKIVGRIKGYHGVTVAAASLTGLPYNHRGFDLPLPGFVHAMAPHHYHAALPGEDEAAFATRCADELEALILAEGPDTVAAMFMEPVMGAGGVIVPPATYHEKIQAVLRRHDILLVADEVVCGFGRTGRYWGCDTYGIRPDIMTCAKALSAAALPISAVLVSGGMFEALAVQSATIGTFGHGTTYSGHPVTAAVALETLRIYDEMDVVARVRALAPVLQSGLRRLAAHDLVGEARGVGLMGGLELVADKAARRNFDPARKVGPRMVRHGLDAGLILRVLPNETIAFSPPFVIDEAGIEEMLARTGQALDALAAELRAEDRARD